MARFRAWVERHLTSKPSAKKHPEHQLPFLPSSRRSIALPTSDAPTCLFFQLPYDIRELILSMALGGRTLHMDLTREHDDSDWQWRNAVCFRKPSNLPTKRYTFCGPWNDGCLRSAHDRNGKSPNYNPGITGFLLTSRQAYHEGIHIFYTTNCISLSSETLLLHLPQLVPPSHLSAITSLEILITARDTGKVDGRWTFSFDHVAPILDHIQSHCHHLRSFLLSFLVASRLCEIHDSPALQFVDAFYRATRLRDMRVEVPRVSYYSGRNHEDVEQHPREAPATSWEDRSYWRSLDGGEAKVHSRSIERYPFPPLRVPVREGEEGAESEGYWLLQGDEGPMSPVVCF